MTFIFLESRSDICLEIDSKRIICGTLSFMILLRSNGNVVVIWPGTLCSPVNLKYVILGDIVLLCISQKLLIINQTAYSPSTRLFYYTLQHVLPDQINHHQVDVRYTKRIIKG